MQTLKDRILRVYKNSGKKDYAEFAESIGVAKSTIDYWMSRGGNPSPSNLKRICTVYNVSEEWLVFGLDVAKDDGVKYNLKEVCAEYIKEIDFLKNQLAEKTEYINMLKDKLKKT